MGAGAGFMYKHKSNMSQKIKYLLYFLFFIGSLFLPAKIYAEMKIAAESGRLKEVIPAESPKTDYRVDRLKDYLSKNNSILSLYSQDFISAADENGIPWSLVPAIAGVESTFCNAVPSYSTNCWGWNNGEYQFVNYKEAISTVSQTLKKYYFDRGLDTPEKIAPVYAPPSKTWAGKVRFFMGKIESHKSYDWNRPLSFS